LPHGGFFLAIGGVAGFAAALLFVLGLRVGHAGTRDNQGAAAVVPR
jgi:POT family proton-dependent oligopeptide transporter